MTINLKIPEPRTRASTVRGERERELDVRARGFTLLELLIVIAIIAILSAILIFVLNPAETLRRGRDSQRINDLKTVHRAISFYITDLAIAGKLVSLTKNDVCASPHIAVNNGRAWVSYSGDGTTENYITGASPGYGADALGPLKICNDMGYNVDIELQDSMAVDKTGWVRIDFTKISSGSPIPRLPLDPNFKVAILSDPDESDLLYTYTCMSCRSPAILAYELNANLESKSFQNGGSEDKESGDGGDNSNLFEVGTNLNILTSP